jgi:hypothetical protein
MTMEQLKDIMKFQLNNFNDEGVEINDKTLHRDVLNEDDGFGHVNSVQLYKDVIRFTLSKQNNKIRKWPEKWLDMNVEDLSKEIL